MPEQQQRRFLLVRDTDVSGISGTGVVAEGVEWTDRSVTVRWRGEYGTCVFHDRGILSVEKIHGHGGLTRIVWLDEE
jgi:hypothetical protein